MPNEIKTAARIPSFRKRETEGQDYICLKIFW